MMPIVIKLNLVSLGFVHDALKKIIIQKQRISHNTSSTMKPIKIYLLHILYLSSAKMIGYKA